MADYFEIFDLVRMPNRSLGLISRLPHSPDSSSEEDFSDDEHPPASPSRPRRLISAYEDVENIHSADSHQHEQPLSPSQPSSSRLPDGFAEVTNFYPVLHRFPDLNLVDRALDRNLVVTNPSRPFQSATVINIHKQLTVRRISSITNPSILPSDTPELFTIPQSHLGFFFGIRQGDTVVHFDRIGIVNSYSADLYVLFSDGSLALVPTHDEQHPVFPADKLTPSCRPIDPNMEGTFYPGQTVKAPPETWTHTAVWLRGAYASIDTAVVTHVRMRDVLVKWLVQNPTSSSVCIHDWDDSKLEFVPYSDLILLDEFRESSWCVGDRGFLVNSHNNTWKKGGVFHATVPFHNEAPRRTHPPQHGQRHHHPAPSATSWPADQHPQLSTPSDQQDVPSGRFFMAQRRARRKHTNAEYIETVEDMIPPSTVNPSDVVQVVATKTYVTLRWQDGTMEENVPAVNLRRNDYMDENDFTPGELVVRKEDAALNTVLDSDKDRRRGAVVRVNNAEKTATVQWANTDQAIGSSWEPQTEEVSVYELVRDDYDYAIGDVILNFNPKSPNLLMDWVGIIIDQQRGEADVKWLGGETTKVNCSDIILVNSATDNDDDDDDDDDDSETEYSEDGNDSDTLRYFEEGGIPHGELRQNWGEVDEADMSHLSDAELGRFSLLTQLQALMSFRKLKPKLTRASINESVQVALKSAIEVVQERKRMRFGSDTLTRDDIAVSAAILVTRTVSELHIRTMLRGDLDHIEQREEEGDGALVLQLELQESLLTGFNELMKLDSEPIASAQQEQDPNRSSSMPVMEVDSQQGKRAAPSNSQGDTVLVEENRPHNEEARNSLPKFEVIEEVHDFHFTPSNELPDRTQMFLFFVSREWRRLRTSLPSGIMVRVCEQHTHIMRAAITGSEGTPYADVIFFFDILMGSRYPAVPPSVWFWSYGRRLNPNLYEDGKVCLSILGTWDGDDIESWHPKTSNLLRVLLSLQALVFVEEPYYNEAGYEKQRGTPVGENNSRGYNENIFLLCVKHIISTLGKGQTPEDCYDIAVKHYRIAGSKILARCRALVRGDVAEANVCSASKSMEDWKRYSSAGFRKSLEQLIPPLENALIPLISCASRS